MAECFLVYKCKNCTNLQTCFCWSVIGMYVLNSKQPVLQWYTMHAQVCLNVLVYCACMLLKSHLQPQIHHQKSTNHTHQHHSVSSLHASEQKLHPPSKQVVQIYIILYWHFGCKLYKDESLIKESVQFKIHQIPHSLCGSWTLIRKSLQDPWELIILYYIIYLD